MRPTIRSVPFRTSSSTCPGERHLIIDSKASLTAYERGTSASTAEERGVHIKHHLTSLRNHIRSPSERNYQQLYARGQGLLRAGAQQNLLEPENPTELASAGDSKTNEPLNSVMPIPVT
jgi:hypothetical protein